MTDYYQAAWHRTFSNSPADCANNNPTTINALQSTVHQVKSITHTHRPCVISTSFSTHEIINLLKLTEPTGDIVKKLSRKQSQRSTPEP